MNRLTDVVKNLLIINVIVFVSVHFLLEKLNIDPYFTLYPINAGFEPYQIVTHMFNHSLYMINPLTHEMKISFTHILFNMFALFMFGPIVENTLGPKRFLFLYLAAGLFSGIAHLFLSDGSAVGASGAINGVIIAFALMYPNQKMMIFPIPIEIKSIIVVSLFILYDLFGGINQNASDHVAHFAHLGGAAMGAFLIFYWGLNAVGPRR